MDIYEQGEHQEQQWRDIHIKNNQLAAAKIDTSNPSGCCWNCSEDTGNERRFCDFNCMTVWSKRNERR